MYLRNAFATLLFPRVSFQHDGKGAGTCSRFESLLSSSSVYSRFSLATTSTLPRLISYPGPAFQRRSCLAISVPCLRSKGHARSHQWKIQKCLEDRHQRYSCGKVPQRGIITRSSCHLSGTTCLVQAFLRPISPVFDVLGRPTPYARRSCKSIGLVFVVKKPGEVHVQRTSPSGLVTHGGTRTSSAL